VNVWLSITTRMRHNTEPTERERGAPLDIREEEGDGTGGEIGHDPSPFRRLVVVPGDCRMADGPSMSEKLTVPSWRSLPWTELVEHVVSGCTQ
jgi:hypothetical protein